MSKAIRKPLKKKGRRLAFHGAREIRRTTFDGMPIVDSTADMTLVVSTKDVEAAKGSERDPGNCILAKACQEKVGASRVAFFRSIAYLDLPDAKGRRRLVRFMLDKDASAVVRAFDRGSSVKGEMSVTLRAPTPSTTLDSVRERAIRDRARKRQALLMGKIAGDSSKARFYKKPNIADLDVRSGTGLVHNTLKKPKRAARS